MTAVSEQIAPAGNEPGAFVGGLGAAAIAADGPDWLRDARQQAAARFAETGLPTPRLEAWKFTDLRGLARLSFAPPMAAEAPLPEVTAAVAPSDLTGPRLVFVDGRYHPGASDTGDLGAGVEVAPMATVLADDPDFVRRHLEDDEEPLEFLNAAFAGDGAVIRVAPGAVCEDAVSLIFVSGAEARPASHPRVLISVGEGARISVIERHAGAGVNPYFVNMVTRFDVGEGARLNHAVIQDTAVQGYYLSTGRVAIAKDGVYDGFVLTVGGRLSRHGVTARLRGPGAECRLSGAYMLRGEQHSDVATVIHHEQPNTTCHEQFKGVVDDTSRGVFQGRIVVHPGADGTDGRQSSRALLLSDKATVDTKPELEIFADDVKCAHGATAGQLDAEALFYLRSRGIPEAEARGMLVRAFVEEAFAEIGDDTLREAVVSRAGRWLAAQRDIAR